jgi:hypothetical protein
MISMAITLRSSGDVMPPTHLYTQGAINRIAVRIGERFSEARGLGRIENVTEDMVRGAIEAVSIYEGLTPDEMRELEEKLLRDVIGRVG